MSRHTSKLVTAGLVLAFYLLFFCGHESEVLDGSRWNGAPSAQALRATSNSVLGIFEKGVTPKPVVENNNNLVAQNEGVSLGPWVLQTPLPESISTDPFTLTFKCTWHAADLCPTSYIVVLRGPTIYSPPHDAVTADPNDSTLVNVTIAVPDPGNYLLYAWPDFNECKHLWKDMTYPINKGQVQSSPFSLSVSGPPSTADSLAPCALDSPEYTSPSTGRWISRNSLLRKYQTSEWAKGYPEKQDYIFQPAVCKTTPHSPAELLQLPSVRHVLFLGDSVLRGSFCTKMYPSLSPSGAADGPCTFINDAQKYHVASKDLVVPTAHGEQRYSFRFMDDAPLARLNAIPAELSAPPSHVVANLGLWLAPLSIDEYRQKVSEFLARIYELWPETTVIWRTTTDVAPMIQCFTDKGMTRKTIAGQRDTAFEIVKDMRGKGMKVYTVDAWKMTAGRPETGNDGRHWVVESPEEWGWLPKGRPEVGKGEDAAVSSVVEILVRVDEEARAKAAKEKDEQLR